MQLIQSLSFAAHVESLLQRHHVPGLSVAVVSNGTIHSNGFGFASLDPPRKCTADTLFNIASASKSLTAASVGFLVNDDEFPRVQYNATLSSLLPDEFVMSEKEYTENVTIEDALGHRTGLPRHDYSYLGIRAKTPDSAEALTRNLRNLAIHSPIRTEHEYCNIMYAVSSYLVEKISGLPFADFLDKHIFQPLDMNSTNLQPSRARIRGLGDRIARGHVWQGENYTSFDVSDDPPAQGAGIIITSSNDYIKYIKAMLHRDAPFNQEVYDGILRLRSIEDLGYENLSPQTSPSLYASGWSLRWYQGRLVVSHDGNDAGFGANHFFVPDIQFGGVILGNTEDASTVATILTNELIDEALNIPGDQRPDWESMLAPSAEDPGETPEDPKETILKELCPGLDKPEPLSRPMQDFSGTYLNQGYHGVDVQIKDGQLFVDATDRSQGFTLTFEHLCNGTKFAAQMNDFYTGEGESIKAEFKTEGDGISQVGLLLESALDDYIWFSKYN